MSADPEDDNESPVASGIIRVKTISIEVRVDDLDWAERYAEYRNALVEIEAEDADDGSEIPKRESRKSVLQELLRARILRTQKILEPITAELGPLPASDDKAAMKKYARRALALANSKRS